MNSGKSDTLIKTAYNYEERGLKVVVVKPTIDTKDDARVMARGGHSRIADVLATQETDVETAVRSHDNVACVLVDEAQFLSREQIGQLFRLTKHDDISVIAYGLRADFRTQLFAGSERLFEVADNIEKLPTMCFCGSQAEFNCRRVNGAYVFEGDQVAIDGNGEVTYHSLCGRCYVREGGHI